MLITRHDIATCHLGQLWYNAVNQGMIGFDGAG